eukprot:CAMPEP_0115168618 /NCGR_PEP_ID=MMETSP0270-20121206/848_1 /TAXON_ID=71861 /ORGANISM="Scrippsiella trochoidea, Strain CCMP3099" /LENGTH=71 /DNA_ID=CAMNT_0002581295 /DNA_START=672 /DNA_END=888 /DNA_ORIENTATION=+
MVLHKRDAILNGLVDPLPFVARPKQRAILRRGAQVTRGLLAWFISFRHRHMLAAAEQDAPPGRLRHALEAT